jgi:hypothetical protein
MIILSIYFIYFELDYNLIRGRIIDMQNNFIKKGLVVGIIIFFIGMSFTQITNGNNWINNSITRYKTIKKNIENPHPLETYYRENNRDLTFGKFPWNCNYVYFLNPPNELEWEYNEEYFNGTINQFRLLASDNTNHTWDLNKFELHINGVNYSYPDTQSFYRRHLAWYEWEIIWNNISQFCSGDILFEVIYLDCAWIEYQGDYDDDGDETFHYSYNDPYSYLNGELDGTNIFDSDKAYIVWYTPINYNPPEAPAKPSGNTSGYICIDHNYSTSTTDPFGLNVSYGWDWDGNFVVDEWTGWYESNETCVISHNWTNPDVYNIRVKAMNTKGQKSNWSSQFKVTILNHPPYSPSNPKPSDKDLNVSINEILCWTGGDPDICDNVVYDVYFGSDCPPPLVSNQQTYHCYDPGTLPRFEDFCWRVVAWDNHGASNSSPMWTFSTGVNHPPYAPTIVGPNSGKQKKELTFVFNSEDPNENDVRFLIEWGDGNSDTTSFITSGHDKTAKHTWDSEGSYVITAKAEDSFGLISDPATWQVTIPRNKEVSSYMFLLRIFERFPLIQRLLNVCRLNLE